MLSFAPGWASTRLAALSTLMLQQASRTAYHPDLSAASRRLRPLHSAQHECDAGRPVGRLCGLLPFTHHHSLSSPFVLDLFRGHEIIG